MIIHARVKSLRSSKVRASEDRWGRAHPPTDSWQVYPASVFPVIISEFFWLSRSDDSSASVLELFPRVF